MQFHQNAAYVRAAAPRPGDEAVHQAELRRSEPPPRPLRRPAATALARLAARLDGESARRALA